VPDDHAAAGSSELLLEREHVVGQVGDTEPTSWELGRRVAA
jgi:hypothetical protein